ncbi:MAG: FAD-dependent oxidoreductase [Saprospiraceae bacterium]|nr:FAD-dependent oxidoreductase [Saprospiraceae bacterium]MBL0026184.1 FAD-dependent oxidoreductase [Saprospiraceae bacterium]
MNITIIGAGVIGMTSAYYLSKEGHDITIIDKGDGSDNCSFGNAGYISPSHFIPLASPGIVAQGLKWMLSNTSPFYIKPRLDASLIRWGLKFYSKSNEKTVAKNAPHLNDILQLSRNLMIDMDKEFDHGFRLEQKGCLMLYKSEKTGKHEIELAHEARRFGLETQILTAHQVQQMEPEVAVEVMGGVYFPIDCHLHPGQMMKSLYSKTQKEGVKILFSHEVEDFETQSDQVKAVITNNGKINCDQLIIAAGSWLEIVSKKLGIQLLLQPGKGYSTTYVKRSKNLQHPAILVDDRVAVTPLGTELRIGGTMELSGINSKIEMNRVSPIVHAVNTYFPDLHLDVQPIEKIWSGLRPCSPDGLPYIGRSPHHNNVIIAGGHAMLGISLAAATGLLIRQLVQKQKTEISIDPFRIDR